MHRVTLMAVLTAGSALSALPAHAAGKLNIICSADVVVCEQMTTLFEKQHPDVNVSMVRLSAGKPMHASAPKRVTRAPIFGGQAPAILICRPPTKV